MKIFKTCVYIVALAILMASCQEQEQPSYQAPTGLISFKEGVQKESVYVENQYAFINDSLQKLYGSEVTDNREVWFDLENLKNYIHYVETQSAEKGYKNLGLRVYLGAEIDNKVPRSTVFFWPTHRKEIDSTIPKNNFLPQNDKDNDNSEDIDGLNYGNSGQPPSGLGG